MYLKHLYITSLFFQSCTWLVSEIHASANGELNNPQLILEELNTLQY